MTDMKIHFEEPPIVGCKTANLTQLAKCKEDGKLFTRQLSLPPDMEESVIADSAASCNSNRDNDEVSLASDASRHTISIENSFLKYEATTAAATAAAEPGEDEFSIEECADTKSFLSLRFTYLIVTLVIMLADGLQGTHLYVLYEGYGFTVANLYCLGFVTGGLASPITGPLVDKLGRKKSAILYCVLEIIINRLEQYPVLAGLIISRMVGGITTNLLSTVFDTWLDTEYRRRGIRKEGGYEIIMRDSVIVSNLAAIGSGYLAHTLAEAYGPKGPFEGAVTCTSIALIVIMFMWSENYGCGEDEVKSVTQYMRETLTAFQLDSRVLKLGIIQGMTCGSIQIFIFLWSPALRHFAVSAPVGSFGLDHAGEPAYGLIFGGFMAAGVLGGLTAPTIRRFATSMMSPAASNDGEQTNEDRPQRVEVLTSLCYLASAGLLLLPCLLDGEGKHSFSICLAAFLFYEYIVGLYLPWEGVLRSIYFPAEGRCSILTLPRIIVNVAVSGGVVLTNYMTMRSAFSSIVVLLLLAVGLQWSLRDSADKKSTEKGTGAGAPELTRASFFCTTTDCDDCSVATENTAIIDSLSSLDKIKRE